MPVRIMAINAALEQMSWLLFEFQVAIHVALNGSLYEEQGNYTVTFKLQMVEGAKIGKLH